MFNRPQLTERLIGVLEKVRPSRLLLVADGPRPGNAEDIKKCAAVRKLFEDLAWDCQVERNFAKSNMGSFKRNSSGISWVFEKVEGAILLEDDCIPDLSFFPFCQELLERYQNEEKVGLISGNNFLQPGSAPGENTSYFFSRYATTWGWASWRRIWRQVDLDMPYWAEFRDSGSLKSTVYTREEEDYWKWIYNSIQERIMRNAWDYQLMLTCLKNNLYTIVPEINLVTNSGFGRDATNCSDETSPVSDYPVESMAFPLRHPRKIESSAKRDYLIFNIRFGKNRLSWISKIMPGIADDVRIAFSKIIYSQPIMVLRRIYRSMPESIKKRIRVVLN